MLNILQIVCVLMFGIISCVEGQNTTTGVGLPIQEQYCPQSCSCGQGSNIWMFYNMTNMLHIDCVWTNNLFNLSEEMTMATVKLESNQVLYYDIDIGCYDDTDIEWTSSDFLQKTKAFRMFNCNIINDGPILFPTDSIIKIFELDALRSPDVDKFQFRVFENCYRVQISNSNLNRIPILSFKLDWMSYFYIRIVLKTKSNPLKFTTDLLVSNLTLSHNSIKVIKLSSFPSPCFLVCLDLSYNQIEIIETTAFDNVVLTELLLHGNNLIEFDSRHVSYNYVLKNVDLRFNQLEYPPFKDGRLPKKRFRTLEVKAAHNPYICDCTMDELMAKQSFQQIFSDKDLMKCQKPAKLQNKSLVSVMFNDSCPLVVKCPMSCACDYNRISNFTSVVCSNKSLSALPLDLPEGNLILNFTSNMIEILDKRDYFPRIVELDLSYNQISDISSAGLTLLSNILTLDLTHNNISSLPRSITQVPFSPETQLYVSSNPWLCSCDLLWFAQWLQDKSSPISDKNQLQCKPMSINVINITEDNLQCDIKLKTYLYYLITIFSLLIIFLIFLIIKYRYNVKVLLYTRLRMQYFAPTIVGDKLKINDVFIVYDDEEIIWIKDVLLKRLENIEKPGYKTILKDRDFVAGLDVDENVNDAICNSYCTLFIFSDNFLQNEWCLYNFHCAYKHMLKEKDMQIVIILKDKIDVHELNDDLKAYFKTHTYLDVNDRLFWDKLLYVLPKNSERLPQENNVIV